MTNLGRCIAKIRLLQSLCYHTQQTRILSHHSVLISSSCKYITAETKRTLLRAQPSFTQVSCNYAKKGKESKKDKKGGRKGSTTNVKLSAEEISEVIDPEKLHHQLDQALNNLKQDYADHLLVRTSAGVFDQLMIDTTDGKFPLLQLGQVANKTPQLIVVNMTTSPQYIPAVKEAILNSGMNLNPQQDGTTIFIPIPKVTREHREKLSHNAKALCDKSKEKMRDVQNRFVRDAKKQKDNHSKDLIFNIQTMIQEKANEYMAKAETIMEAKQQEILNK